MAREINSGSNPFAFERIAQEMAYSESRHRLIALAEHPSELPEGPAAGLEFGFAVKVNPNTTELVGDHVGESIRMHCKIGVTEDGAASKLTNWRGDARTELVRAGEPRYHVTFSRIVIGEEMLEWEMIQIAQEVGREFSRDDDLPEDAPYFAFTALEGKIVHVIRLHPLHATDEQFRMGMKVWSEKGGKIDMGYMRGVWLITVDPYSRQILSMHRDGDDDWATDVEY